ncbi:MAG: YitT family protein [Lachnospiraceae bacterium]|nr:YitT family protein [Lachnospiraceae bacterium]
MKENKICKILLDFLVIILGNTCIAVAVAFFVIPNKLLVGGTAGIAVALNKLWGFPEETVIHVLVYALFIAGAIILNRDFIIKTITSTIVYPLLLTLVSELYEIIPVEYVTMDTLTSIVCSGVLVGFGIGIVYKRNASTGGMDIIPLIVNKYTGLPLHILLLMVDCFTVLLGFMAYGLQAAIYGVISVAISSFIIDKTILLGAKQTKQVQIISQKSDEILDKVLEELDRGCTIMESRGGYTNQRRDMLMVVVPIDEYQKLINTVHKMDPSAFVIVSDIKEIRGRGFTLSRESGNN